MKPTVQVLGNAVLCTQRQNGEVSLSTFIPLKIHKRGGRREVVRPDGESLPQGSISTPFDTPLLVTLRRAFYWQQLIGDGVVESCTDIAQSEGLHHSTVNKLLRLTLLEPAIVQSIFAVQQPRCMSLRWLQVNPLPADWIGLRSGRLSISSIRDFACLGAICYEC